MPGFYSPCRLSPADAKAETRILAIGAHPDDIEFMCLEPILRCRAKAGFGGLIVTSGSGSLRSPAHAKLSGAEYAELRWQEQRLAADIGCYSFVDSLNVESHTLKNSEGFSALVSRLESYLSEFDLEELYVHQPFDRHASHVRVSLAVLEALRRMPAAARPKRVLGCEVWRNLDWVPNSLKVLRPLEAEAVTLQRQLAEVFSSQADAENAKNYVGALLGRKTANAVFQEGVTPDAGPLQEVYLDLTSWIDSERSLNELGLEVLRKFQEDVFANWS